VNVFRSLSNYITKIVHSIITHISDVCQSFIKILCKQTVR